MGAGVQRWWRDRGRIEVELEDWRLRKQEALSRTAARCSTREIPVVRATAKAYRLLWQVIDGVAPPRMSIAGNEDGRHG